MTDTFAPPTIRINPDDAKFKPGNYHWEVTKAVFFQSEKNTDWKALRVHVKCIEGKMNGQPGQFFLQLPEDPEDPFYRSKLNDLVKFASACAGAVLEDEFELEFAPGEEGEFIAPLFIGADFWAGVDVDDNGYLVFKPSKFYLSDPNAAGEDSPY